jgi:chromatin remodeling complex protein RSC6
MTYTFVLPILHNNQTSTNNSFRRHAPSKFCTPIKISDKLSQFLGIEKGTKMTCINVTREVNKYIRLNYLQDKENKFIINPDSKISLLFGLNIGDKLTHLNIQKYIGSHMIYDNSFLQ